MSFFSGILIVLGLGLFETVSSVDNAIINAEVLSTMGKRAQRWFLVYGFFLAVVVVRGVLPWLIVWLATPGLSPIEALTVTFSNDTRALTAVEASAPLLLVGGGLFLILLFFHWLFLEEKNYGLIGEQFLHKQGVWFFAVASVILSVVVWFALQIDPILAFSAVVGSTAFFILHGLKEHAEKSEKELMQNGISDFSKILYLELIDATFSIDSVLGAFAFTLSVPLILVGNGLGAIIVRWLTVGNIERIKKYRYLKNGAMYSIFFLGLIMLLGAFGVHIAEWISPAATFLVIAFFIIKSNRERHLQTSS